ncbi:hypothetical protein PR048_030449 [Dryococelus australis]|uniref:Uncharacterized protein n=1 Tax=Dryococelus australis TaxID=614101 RepID=A0ABQ9G9H2_9NEOP|nr:hypothetical protein PR048_030449 [Dryococelus australis]
MCRRTIMRACDSSARVSSTSGRKSALPRQARQSIRAYCEPPFQGRGGLMARLLASHIGSLILHLGIVPEDASGFSRGTPVFPHLFIAASLRTHLASASSAFQIPKNRPNLALHSLVYLSYTYHNFVATCRYFECLVPRTSADDGNNPARPRREKAEVRQRRRTRVASPPPPPPCISWRVASRARRRRATAAPSSSGRMGQAWRSVSPPWRGRPPAMHLHFERNTNSKCDCAVLSLTWMGKVPDELPEPMRVTEVSGGTRDPRENPPTSGIVRHDSHVRKSGSDPASWELNPSNNSTTRRWYILTSNNCGAGVSERIETVCNLAEDPCYAGDSGTFCELLTWRALLTDIDHSRDRGGVVVIPLASYQGELGSTPVDVALGFSHVGIVPNDAAVGGFSRGSLVCPALALRSCSILTLLLPHRLSRPRWAAVAQWPDYSSSTKGNQVRFPALRDHPNSRMWGTWLMLPLKAGCLEGIPANQKEPLILTLPVQHSTIVDTGTENVNSWVFGAYLALNGKSLVCAHWESVPGLHVICYETAELQIYKHLRQANKVARRNLSANSIYNEMNCIHKILMTMACKRNCRYVISWFMTSVEVTLLELPELIRLRGVSPVSQVHTRGLSTCTDWYNFAARLASDFAMSVTLRLDLEALERRPVLDYFIGYNFEKKHRLLFRFEVLEDLRTPTPPWFHRKRGMSNWNVREPYFLRSYLRGRRERCVCEMGESDSDTVSLEVTPTLSTSSSFVGETVHVDENICLAVEKDFEAKRQDLQSKLGELNERLQTFPSVSPRTPMSDQSYETQQIPASDNFPSRMQEQYTFNIPSLLNTTVAILHHPAKQLSERTEEYTTCADFQKRSFYREQLRQTGWRILPKKSTDRGAWKMGNAISRLSRNARKTIPFQSLIYWNGSRLRRSIATNARLSVAWSPGEYRFVYRRREAIGFPLLTPRPLNACLAVTSIRSSTLQHDADELHATRQQIA